MISENNTTTSEHLDFTDIYKKWYYDEKDKSNHYWEQLREESHLAATVTGYLSGMAKWNTAIPKRDRINILNLLIETYEPKVDNSEMYSRWISEWKEYKENLEK